ncbi:MAG: hypothetical protein JXL81_08870 [Deltaproteobacteria bacterium]|nr:hypothetical protein [Deltaproteobacteria bacterium]
MDPFSIDIEDIFFSYLEKKGVEHEIMERFVKDLINSKFDDPNKSLNQVSSHLKSLGWEDAIIDYQTLQLAQAYLENVSSLS